MKKQIFILILSVAVFATTALFAMENDLFNENKSYRITISQLQLWMQAPNPEAEKNISWLFSINNREFRLSYVNENDEIKEGARSKMKCNTVKCLLETNAQNGVASEGISSFNP